MKREITFQVVVYQEIDDQNFYSVIEEDDIRAAIEMYSLFPGESVTVAKMMEREVESRTCDYCHHTYNHASEDIHQCIDGGEGMRAVLEREVE